MVIAIGFSRALEVTSGLRSSKYGGYTDWKQILWYGLSQLSRSIVGTSLILTGRMIALGHERIAVFFAQKSRRTYICTGIFLLLGFVLGNMQYNFVDLHFSFIRNPALFYSSALCTTIGLILTGQQINIKGINWLGKNSLIIMFCQIIQKYWCSVLNRLLGIESNTNTGWRYPVSFASLAVCLVLSAIVVWLINHNRFLNLLIRPKGKGKGNDRS